MAIIGPDKLPVVLRKNNDETKFEVLSTLGHPVIANEITEPQLEQAIRSTCDFIATYFPSEQKYAYFNTQPLVNGYNLPQDAYWVQNVSWDPATTRIGDIFGAECLRGDCLISLYDGKIQARDLQVGSKILSYSNGNIVEDEIISRKESGMKKCLEITADDSTVVASFNHKFMSENGWKLAKDLTVDQRLYMRKSDTVILAKISSIVEVGEFETYDFETKEFHNLIANDFVVHNSFLFNIGNVTGIQNLLLDYHMLLSYRKFSQRILGTEGQWEVKGDNKIRLFPTPRGSFPVVIEYIPVVNHFRSPWARELTKRALIAEAKIMIGNVRSKFGNIPAPGGGSLSLNGEQMRTEGQQEKEKTVQDAILHSEPLGPILH